MPEDPVEGRAGLLRLTRCTCIATGLSVIGALSYTRALLEPEDAAEWVSPEPHLRPRGGD